MLRSTVSAPAARSARRVSSSLAAALLGVATPAAAVVLGPGESGVPAGLTPPSTPTISGLVIFDQTYNLDFQNADPDDPTGSYNAFVAVRVFRRLADRGLTFDYRVVNADSLFLPASLVEARGFGGVSVDANYLIDGGAVAPTRVERSADGEDVGFDIDFIPPSDQIDLNDPDALPATNLLTIATDATAFDFDGAFFFDNEDDFGPLPSFNTTTALVTGLPSPVVPEPATAAAVLAAGAFLRRRRAR